MEKCQSQPDLESESGSQKSEVQRQPTTDQSFTRESSTIDPTDQSPTTSNSSLRMKEKRNASPAITSKYNKIRKRVDSNILSPPNIQDREKTQDLFRRFADESGEMSADSLRLLLIEMYPAAARMNPMRLSTFLNQFFVDSIGESVSTINFIRFQALWKQTDQFAAIETGELVVSKLLESTAESIPSYVEQCLTFRKLERKEILFLEGEQPEYFYIVLSGAFRIYRENDETIQILDEIGVGATVGDFVLFLKDDKYPFSCCALRNSTLIAIPLPVIKEFMQNKPDFYYRIIKHLLISVKRFDHLTLYHNLFEEESDKPPKLHEKIGKMKDLIHWDLRDILGLHWDIQNMPQKTIEELVQFFSKKQFPSGSKLCHHRLTYDAYIILKGSVKYIVKTRHKEMIVARKGVGETIGLISVLCGLNIEASVVADQDTTVLSLPKKAFEWLAINYRKIIDEIVETRITNTVNRLKKFNVGYRYIKISKDTYLCKRGESTEVFLVLTGELEEQKSASGNTELISTRIVNYFGPGDLVGVKSLVSGKPSSTSIKATRTSEVVMFNITKEQLREMVMERPQLFETLISNKKCKTPIASGMSIAIVPLTSNIDVEEFSQIFMEKISQLGPSIRLTRADINRNFGISAKATDIPNHLPLWWWTNDLVVKYNYVLYQADNQSPNWTRLAIQQADCVLLLISGDSKDDKIDTSLRPYLEKAGNIHFVHIHSKNVQRKFGSFNSQLMEKNLMPATMIHNVIHLNGEDYARVARICTGNAIGLALGGGSCRGLAHIGVIKALKEEGIPIDIIGGTSAGSIVSSFYAGGENLNSLANTFVKVFTLSNWIKDFTLPFMSFLSGVEIRKTMKKLFGNTNIEDLHIPMFAVSTNMHTYKEHLHRKGPLWLAVRSSIALPPFMPPVKTSEGLFLDGGFVNKVPVEFCRNFGARYVIGVDVSFKYHFGDTLPESYTDASSGFKIIFEKLTGGTQYLSVMEIMTELGYLIDNNRKPDERADVFITPPGMDKYGTFTTAKEAPTIIQKGYEEAKIQLQRLKFKEPEKWKRMAICNPVILNDPEVFIKIEERPLRTKKRFQTSVVISLLLFSIFSYRWWKYPLWKWIKTTFY